MSDSEYAKVIGRNVRIAREKAELTQLEVSSRTGIAVPHLSRLETGNHLPSLKTVKRVAEALGVDVCSLLPKPAARKPRGKESRP